jgi:hypothetical protein
VCQWRRAHSALTKICQNTQATASAARVRDEQLRRLQPALLLLLHQQLLPAVGQPSYDCIFSTVRVEQKCRGMVNDAVLTCPTDDRGSNATRDVAGEIHVDMPPTADEGDQDHDVEMTMPLPTKKGESQKAGAKCFDDGMSMRVPTQSKNVPLGEDVYSLIFICPVSSAAFVFAVYTHILKMVLMAFLLSDLTKEQSGTFGYKDATVTITQFLLLPVAIALQDDLMKVYMRVANMSYDIAITKDVPSAHKSKLFLSYFLQFLDGITSLSVNFIVMLKTDRVLDIFLNFAALHFIQNIDNAAFSLAESGFLLKSIEEYCCIAKSSSLPWRVDDFSTIYLDTILFTATCGLLLILYFLATFSN